MKLMAITFDRAPRIPGVRPGDLSTVDCSNPTAALKGWRFLLRGPSVFFVSPPGWMTGRPPHDWNPKGDCSVHQVPMADCFLHWSGDPAEIDTVLTKGKFDSPAFGSELPVQEPPVSLLSKLDKKDIGDP